MLTFTVFCRRQSVPKSGTAQFSPVGRRLSTKPPRNGHSYHFWMALLALQSEQGISAACPSDGPYPILHLTMSPQAIDERTTRHESHARSQRNRKRIEEAFGWPRS